ncbi:MAG TPA: YceI family protein [Streptosporangiaceae bacterium]|nr:YceI family protein [Streptosporangiaceae bacterium]
MDSWPFSGDRLRATDVVPDPVTPAASASGTPAQARTRPNPPARKRRWWRWILVGTAAVIVLVVLAAGLFVRLQPTAPPLALPAAPAGSPIGPLDGTWAVGAGSVAGFRLRETVLGFSNDVAGRTTAVTGTMVVAGDRVTSAMFRVDLTAVTVGGKAQPQFARSLGTRDHPTATFTLAKPVALGPAFGSGKAVTVTATGYLTMNGVSRPVTFAISGRRDGSAIQAAGSIPVTFAEWRIAGPAGYGLLGSLASHGAAEFLLVLQRSTPGAA